jgi:hypothetical protein
MDEGNTEKFLIRHGESGGEAELARKDIADLVLEGLEQQHADAGFYFNAIPDGYKKLVNLLAEENHSHFKDLFPSLESFREAMSKNWLAKVKAFESIVERGGYRKIEPTATTRDVLNRSSIACLSSSASYVLVGPGSLDLNKKGAAGMYVKISLRAEGPKAVASDHGVSLGDEPAVGKHLFFSYPTGNLSTTAITAAYYKEGQDDIFKAGNNEDLQHLIGTINASFQEIDDRTFTGNREELD